MNDITQSITHQHSSYGSVEMLDNITADKIALKCYNDGQGDWNVWGFNGRLKGELEDFVSLIETTFNLKEFSRNITNLIDRDNVWTNQILLANEDCLVSINNISKVDKVLSIDNVANLKDTDRKWDYNINIAMGGTRKQCEIFVEFFRKHIEKINVDSRGIYCMIDGQRGLELCHVGFPGKKIIETNYSAEVVAGFRRIVADIGSDTPAGCLSILSGEPGTGKTFFVKALIEEADKDALFVMIPPSIVASMSGPSMIPLLLDIKTRYLEKKKCVVFIVEDADSILTARGPDNMSSISTLLNCSDGILGSIFGMRIVATTNAPSVDIDKALVRPGRLSCKLGIGELSKQEAITAYDAITKTSEGKNVITKSMTLAEVYAFANGNTYVCEESKNKIGF